MAKSKPRNPVEAARKEVRQKLADMSDMMKRMMPGMVPPARGRRTGGNRRKPSQPRP